MKNSIKKLTLNKMTISNLDATAMNQMLGGAGNTAGSKGPKERKANSASNMTSRCTLLSICC